MLPISDAQLAFDPDAPEFVRDPFPTLRRMREQAPIFDWGARHMLLFFRHDHIRQIFGEKRLTTQRSEWEFHQPQLIGDPRFRAMERILGDSLFTLPPADHARVRKLASVALTPRAVERQRDMIRAKIDALLDRVVAAGGSTINVREFADELPVAVIGELVGVAPDQLADFRRFSQAVLRSLVPNQPEAEMLAIADEITRGVALLERLIAEHREHPRDTLLGDLLRARDEQEQLSEDELVSLVAALIVGGSDTTVHGLCYAVWTLLSHPEQLAQLQADRSLLRNAIEETLRFNPFGKLGVFRYASEELEFAGVTIPKGKMVMSMVTAAGRDPEAFAEPDRFDIRRDLSNAITFGLGRHFCLGANLARLELELAVSTLLLDRFPQARLEREPEFEPHVLLRPMSELMIRV